MIDLINIGNRLSYIRDTYDLTQKNVADLFGIEKSSIAHFEKNDRIIPIEHLITFSDYLNLSIDYILGFTNVKQYPDHLDGVSLSAMASRINEICVENKLTNVALAKVLNSCESNIRNYKNGKYLILTTFTLQLVEKYNYSFDWIVGKTNHKFLTGNKK